MLKTYDYYGEAKESSQVNYMWALSEAGIAYCGLLIEFPI